LIVAGMVGVGLFRFRHRPGMGEPRPHFGNRKLEIIWTAGPILIVIWLLALTAQGMREADPPANREPDLVVIGHQWWWEIRYPGAGADAANEIHIPVGRKCLVRLESADVIHDFWVPALARKMQMIPGQTNHIWLEAGSRGRFDGACVEYCGTQHSWMRLSVVAEPSSAFEAWLGTQNGSAALAAGDPVKNGMKLFQAMTCVNCHSIRGVSSAGHSAPDLTHVRGRQMLGGGVLLNNETNLFRWLKNPQAFKPGCLMPDLKLTDAQVGDLAGYLETLQ
jgi:cytochrome c oxidase subunit 2